MKKDSVSKRGRHFDFGLLFDTWRFWIPTPVVSFFNLSSFPSAQSHEGTYVKTPIELPLIGGNHLDLLRCAVNCR